MRHSHIVYNIRTKHLLLLLFSLLPLALPAQPLADGQLEADTLSIRFRLDSIRIDMDYAGNRAAWQRFLHIFETHFAGKSPRAIRLDIYSGASPEGTAAHNRWLGENRGQAIRRLVRQQLPGRIGTITVHNEAARWDGLYEAVAQSQEPWRDEVLRIIDQPASADENQRDHREQQLRQLHRGTVWPRLLDHYLAPLRSGASAILTWDARRDTIYIRDTLRTVIPYRADGGTDQGKQFAPPPAPAPKDLGPAAAQQAPRVRRPAWILRTNLPLLAVGTPNAQVEWSLGNHDRWSLNLEFAHSWWTFFHNAYANEILYGSAELRLWLGNRRRHHTLAGWHLGLGIGGGIYDLEWKSRGYQGEAISAFLNVGWQCRFGRRRQWAFDAGIGLGFLHSPYRRYLGSTLYPESHTEQWDDHLMWQETSRLNWIGTPHANISIGYVFQPRRGLRRRQLADQRDALRQSFRDERDALRQRERDERDSLYLRLYDLPRRHRQLLLDSLTDRHLYRRDSLDTRQHFLRDSIRADRQLQRQALKARQQTIRQTLKDQKAARKQAAKDRKAARKTTLPPGTPAPKSRPAPSDPRKSPTAPTATAPVPTARHPDITKYRHNDPLPPGPPPRLDITT